MKNCLNCSKKINISAKFCNFCGASQSKISPSLPLKQSIDTQISPVEKELDYLGIVSKEGKYFFDNYAYDNPKDAISYAKRKRGDVGPSSNLEQPKTNQSNFNSGPYFGIAAVLLIVVFFFFLINPANKTSNVTKGGAIVPKDQGQNSQKTAGAEFSDQDIYYIKLQIIEEYEKRPGVEVISVNLIKETRNKLAGFVKIRVYGQEYVKNCSATMGEDSRYVWQCD